MHLQVFSTHLQCSVCMPVVPDASRFGLLVSLCYQCDSALPASKSRFTDTFPGGCLLHRTHVHTFSVPVGVSSPCPSDRSVHDVVLLRLGESGDFMSAARLIDSVTFPV